MDLQARRGGRPCIWVGGIVGKSHPAGAALAGSLQAGFVVILTRCTQSVRYDKTGYGTRLMTKNEGPIEAM